MPVPHRLNSLKKMIKTISVVSALFLMLVSLPALAHNHIDESKIDKPYYTKELQKCLNAIGYDVGKADGIMGKKTRKASNEMIDAYNAKFGKNYAHDLFVYYPANYCKSLQKATKPKKSKPVEEKLVLSQGSFLATLNEGRIGGKKEVQVNWTAWRKPKYEFSMYLDFFASDVFPTAGKNMQLDDRSKGCTPEVWPRCTGARTANVAIGSPHSKVNVHCGGKVRTMNFPSTWTALGRDIGHRYPRAITCTSTKPPSKIEAM